MNPMPINENMKEVSNEPLSKEIPEGYLKELKRQEARKSELAQLLKEALKSEERIVFEAGCGHGHWLTSYAMKAPEHCCLGIDLIASRIAKANNKKDKRSLNKLHFLKAELTEFLEVLPEYIRFQSIIFLFPDPWPKARHHKNRMIQYPLLELLAQKIAPGGKLFFRTDDRGYYDWTVEHLEASKVWAIDKDAEWIHEEATYFQDLMDSYYSVIAQPIILNG
tara:strand:+ start:89 stop:754 length:666 start_codon:yes stop_codon:yes gene_type:complete